MFYDSKHNGFLTTLGNLYANLTTAAMKMHNYVRAMPTFPTEKFIKGFYLFSTAPNSDLIEKTLRLQYTLTRTHFKGWQGAACTITETQVRWYHHTVVA
jgi:hypothetical protein